LNSLHSYSSEITVQDAITTTPNGVRQLQRTTNTSNENINGSSYIAATTSITLALVQVANNVMLLPNKIQTKNRKLQSITDDKF
jgi:hypothetical protein